MRNATDLTLVLALVLAACSSSESPTPSKTSPAIAKLERATAADLAKDIDDAERLGTWRETQTKWQGQTVTWNVYRYSPLCRSAEACNVSAFPLQDGGAKSGWMPKLSFGPGQYAALEAACKDSREATCAVTIEGTLDTLALTPDAPTNVHLDKVRVIPRTAQR